MTTLTLQIKRKEDLHLLLPLIKRLQIAYSSKSKETTKKKISVHALQTYYEIIKKGASELNIDEMLNYLTETRKDRTISLRK